MKILIVNKFLYPNGGSESYIFRLGEQLQKMGHEVQFFGMEHEGRIVGNHAESYTSDMDFHSGRLAGLLYPFKIIYSKEARRKIRQVLDDFQPDAVHLNNFNFQLTPSVLYEIDKYRRDIGNKVKIVFTAHDSQLVCPNHLMQQYISRESCTKCIGGSPWNCTKYKCIHGSFVKSLLGSIEAFLYRSLGTYHLIDTVICPSNFMKEKLDTCRELQGKTIVMHNFAEPCEKRESAEENKEPYVLYFGRYSKEKGIETLLKVCKNLPEIRFAFAGNGPLEEKVNKITNIINRGFMTGGELAELVQNAEFSVFPSECNENCPLSVIESLAYGVPVIGAAIGGVTELIEDGSTGYLFESGNEKQLCERIKLLWEDKEKLRELKAECLKTEFDTIESYCKKMISFYR